VSERDLSNEDLRRALEALRNGVPNRDAVRVLGCSQTEVVERFLARLDAVDGDALKHRQTNGMLVAGEFGSGKSHLLEYLRHLALERGFVCSLIVVSKETPLYDPAKVFAAAVESAMATGITGEVIKEIALRLDATSPAYGEFFRWADDPASGISTVFPATLLIRERLTGDPEMDEKIGNFWAGERLPIADVRQGMKQIRQAATYQLRSPAARELPRQRFAFVSRLMRAAGYRGWVLLIDEVELIARYSRLQRAKAYAELARWMGQVETAQYPGMLALATITVDFEAKVLRETGDRDFVRPFLEHRGTEESLALAAEAETGMREIERRAIPLNPPDNASLRHTYEALRQIHGDAYDWTPPDLPVGATSITRQMRSYVRRWINEWDLRRLYPGEAIETVETELTIDYSESPDLLVESDQSSPDSPAGA